MPIKIAPSILSANFAFLAQEVEAVAQAGADEIHIDVMDGCFVPNITIGPVVVQAIKRASPLPLDVHLMIAEPDRYLDDFIKAGADCLSVHREACGHLDRTLVYIREQGVLAGLALNPATGLDGLEYILDKVDRLLIMSVNPGLGGQKFIPASLEKLRRARELISAYGLEVELSVDGGVNLETAASVVEAGAGHLVAGSAIFQTPDYKKTIAVFRQLTEPLSRSSE